MKKSRNKYTVIVSKHDSATDLERFVRLFHQDFGLMHCDPAEWATGYFYTLSNEEKRLLSENLKDLLEAYPGKRQVGLRKAWFRLGAEWWDKKRNLRSAIEKWIDTLG